MKASQFSDAQKAFILKQGSDGVPVADICRKAGISQATYFNWKKKYWSAPIRWSNLNVNAWLAFGLLE
jgi:transposase-like protein